MRVIKINQDRKDRRSELIRVGGYLDRVSNSYLYGRKLEERSIEEVVNSGDLELRDYEPFVERGIISPYSIDSEISME